MTLELKIKELKTKIQNLNSEIENSPYSNKEALDAFVKCEKILENFNPKNIDEFTKFTELQKIASKVYLQKQVAKYRETLKKDLMFCPCKYVITDSKDGLESPAGFHPDDKVYVQTGLAIHVNDLSQVPESNVELFSHKLD